MTEKGLTLIYAILEKCFREKKVTNITAAMQQYEGIKRNPDDGAKAFVTRSRDAERVMQESGMTPYVDEARGNKFLVAMRLHASDVRNVMI